MSAEGTIDLGRLARSVTLIMFVTATFMLVAANRFEGEIFQIAAVAIGAIAFLTAITVFLIAAGQFYDESEVAGVQD
jgi:hypothetical protein